MQTTDIKIKYNNKVSDNQSNPCVVVFTDITNSPDASAIAWQVIKNIDIDDWYTFNYTFATSIQVTWNQGKSGTSIIKVQNSSWLFEDTEKGFSLVETDSRATPNQFDVSNKASIPGGISVTAFKDRKPIAVKHTVAKDQKAKFIFHPKLYWAVVDDIDVGDIIYLEDIPTYREISLEDFKSLTVTLKGCLQDGYTFIVSEKIPASGDEPIEPIEPVEPVEPTEPIKPCPPEKSSKSEDAIAPLPEVLVESGEHHDLFPFVYMRTWLDINPEERQQRFVEYDINKVPPKIKDGSLYSNLADKATKPDARSQMEEEARSFINAGPANSGKPYAGQFIQNIREINGYIKYFLQLDTWLGRQHCINLSTIKDGIEKLLGLGGWTKIKEYITGKKGDPPNQNGEITTENTEVALADYLPEKDRVWQNFFALTILPDYRPHLLDEITKTLVMCNLLEKLVENEQNSHAENEMAAKDAAIYTSQEIREAAKATIILPKDIFPLPPANKGESPIDSKPTEWIEPYAIGDLQIVRQRLLKYTLGEVDHIENVLKGERKETTQRKLNRINEAVTNSTGQSEENDDDIYGTRTDLLNETRKTLTKEKVTTNFNDFNTSYGPPTMLTYKGSWSVENEPDQQNPYIENVANFAKDITTRTANRIARYVNQVRTLSTLDEAEETVIHAFDNRNSTSNVIGIYRWVNKIYSAHVVNYGHRMMIEFTIQNPAKPYIKSALNLQGVFFEEPTAPDKHNPKIDSYKAITRENYAELAISYEVKQLQPPPPKNKMIPAVFKDGEPNNIKKILVPEGYIAKSASVTCVLSGDNQIQLKGLVGKYQFELDKTGSLESQAMNDEDSAIAACVICNTEQMKASPNKYCVSIEINCELSDEAFAQWQIQTYNAILEGYQKQKAAYYATADIHSTGIGSYNPLENRQIEKKEIKKCCTRQLIRQHTKLVGDSDNSSDNNKPSDLDVNYLKYLQFFDQAFEWDEITYHFYPQWEEENNQERLALTALNPYSSTDSLFTSFLQAGSARVLVPVRPNHTMLVLYYLSSGTIWSGANALTPTINDNKYVSLVNELKILSQVEHECKYVSKPWEITIPTSMIMLQDGSKLPQFQP